MESGQEKEQRLLRDSVLVLRQQLQQALTVNAMLRNVLFQCPQLAHILSQLLRQPGYCLTLTFQQKNSPYTAHLPITTVELDSEGRELQIFHRARNGSNQPIFLCSSWCIELTAPPYTSAGECWQEGSGARPVLASFTTDRLRLQTDSSTQVQLFHAQGHFLDAAMTCPFTLTTRNCDQQTNGARIKRPKGCVFLTSLLLSINLLDHHKQLTTSFSSC